MTPPETAAGWIGTGVMGRSMCGHVIDAGYGVTVNNRTRSGARSPSCRTSTWEGR